MLLNVESGGFWITYHDNFFHKPNLPIAFLLMEASKIFPDQFFLSRVVIKKSFSYWMTDNLKLRMLLVACNKASFASFNVISFVSFPSIATIESPSLSPTCCAFESSLTFKLTLKRRSEKKAENLRGRLLSAFESLRHRWFSSQLPSRPLLAPNPLASLVQLQLSGEHRR